MPVSPTLPQLLSPPPELTKISSIRLVRPRASPSRHVCLLGASLPRNERIQVRELHHEHHHCALLHRLAARPAQNRSGNQAEVPRTVCGEELERGLRRYPVLPIVQLAERGHR